MVLSFFRRSKPPVADLVCEPDPATPDAQDQAFSDTVKLGFLEGTGFVSYQWLVDPKKQIVGYHMHWRPRGEHASASRGVQLQALVTTLGDALVDRRVGYALGRTGLLLDVTAQALSGIHWCGLPPKYVVLRLRGEELCSEDPALVPLLKDLRE
ncbi:MAG TPA: hypothetical protein VKD22_07945, partial [Ramlibacter sp.]|nr:hypothetical protein [Ramlibacter sp.]